MTDLTITITAFDIAIFWIVIVGAIVAALFIVAKRTDRVPSAPADYDSEGA